MDLDVRQGHSHGDGATLDRVRLNEVVTHVVFLGRRRRVYKRLCEVSAAHLGERVLDVGCGGGYLSRLLAAAVGEEGAVTGVDPSATAIEYARRKAPGNCEFTVGVAQHLDQPDESFDLVTSTLAIHHIPDDARLAAFRQMYRVLRPGGRLLVADFRPGGRIFNWWRRPPGPLAFNWWRRPPGPLAFSLHGRGRAMRHGDAIPLDELATQAGFRIEGDGELPLLRYVRAVRD